MKKDVCSECKQRGWISEDGLCDSCFIKFGIDEEIESLKVGELKDEKNGTE